MQLFLKAAVVKINYYDKQTLQRNLLPPSSGQNKKSGMKNNYGLRKEWTAT